MQLTEAAAKLIKGTWDGQRRELVLNIATTHVRHLHGQPRYSIVFIMQRDGCIRWVHTWKRVVSYSPNSIFDEQLLMINNAE